MYIEKNNDYVQIKAELCPSVWFWLQIPPWESKAEGQDMSWLLILKVTYVQFKLQSKEAENQKPNFKN